MSISEVFACKNLPGIFFTPISFPFCSDKYFHSKICKNVSREICVVVLLPSSVHRIRAKFTSVLADEYFANYKIILYCG